MSSSRPHGAARAEARSGATPRENLLLIHCHDLGRHLACYGIDGVDSPNLDALASDGILFTDAHATAPLCSPARGSIFTGRYPHRNGLIGLAHHGFEYHRDVRTLPTMLSEVGYRTALFGMQHESADPGRLGFDTVDVTETQCDHVVGRAQEWLHAHVHASDERPFLLTAGFVEAHRPYPAEQYEHADPSSITVPSFLPDTDDVREDLAGLHGSIARADAAAGRLLATVAELGLDDTTWVVFFTDHGLAFPRAKSTLYAQGTGIALIIRPPTRRGVDPHTYDDLFSGVDLTPTLVDLLSVPVPGDVDGESHAEQLLDPHEAPARTEVFTEKTYHDAFDPIRAVRTKEFSYIESYAERPRLLLPLDIAESPSARSLDLSETRSPRARHELYDLLDDPDEQINLAGDPAHADTRRRFAHMLADWRTRTEDVIPDDGTIVDGF
ncbi:sulfatase-like hydrolase/transferase [Gordonia sp. SID5947]|uniref:sulfatase family protein n=1 Tax=Gordonia sp. SID5947 TaxID=2690315 RepID=UPI0013698078|nr:sulfatase [Gordonia sp. SID5947]MYR07720.1 sulfatase-like hydrolase/transferase [Gordonia sp. SID5947]